MRSKLVIHLLILTLKSPELQHQGAALQVVEQTLGGVEGGDVNSVTQLRVDIVPHSWCEQTLSAVKQPEPDTVEGKMMMNFFFRVYFCLITSKICKICATVRFVRHHLKFDHKLQ